MKNDKSKDKINKNKVSDMNGIDISKKDIISHNVVVETNIPIEVCHNNGKSVITNYDVVRILEIHLDVYFKEDSEKKENIEITQPVRLVTFKDNSYELGKIQLNRRQTYKLLCDMIDKNTIDKFNNKMNFLSISDNHPFHISTKTIFNGIMSTSEFSYDLYNDEFKKIIKHIMKHNKENYKNSDDTLSFFKFCKHYFEQKAITDKKQIACKKIENIINDKKITDYKVRNNIDINNNDINKIVHLDICLDDNEWTHLITYEGNNYIPSNVRLNRKQFVDLLELIIKNPSHFIDTESIIQSICDNNFSINYEKVLEGLLLISSVDKDLSSIKLCNFFLETMKKERKNKNPERMLIDNISDIIPKLEMITQVKFDFNDEDKDTIIKLLISLNNEQYINSDNKLSTYSLAVSILNKSFFKASISGNNKLKVSDIAYSISNCDQIQKDIRKKTASLLLDNFNQKKSENKKNSKKLNFPKK